MSDEGDCEVVGEDLHADIGEGCMNKDGNDFLKLKIPDGVKKDANIKTIAKGMSYFVLYLFSFLFVFHLTNLCI